MVAQNDNENKESDHVLNQEDVAYKPDSIGSNSANDNQIEKVLFLFGSKDDQEHEKIYARFAMGDPVSVIAADLGVSESIVYKRMRKYPDLYEETKKAREAFIGLRLQRSVSLIDAHNLRILEDITEGRINPTQEQMKELNRWSKDLSTRLQLHEGKATAIIRTDDKKLSREEALKILEEQKEAGDGLCTDI